jgi:methionyl-tRNA formyltransferase
MGTSDFSLKALAALWNGGFNVVAVYTQPPKPFGRNYKIHKSSTHLFAEANNIPVYTPKTLRNAEQEELLNTLHPDLVIVSSYGLIIPQNLLVVPTYGFVNIHASLLPRWRGAAPIQMSLLAGDKRTGISLMKMDSGVDTGDIIAMEFFEIPLKMNAGALSDELASLGATMLLKMLESLEENLRNAVPQPNGGIAYAAKISKESCRIDWNDSCENILRRIRAFSPTPSAWSEIDGARIKILDAYAVDGTFSNGSEPGRIIGDRLFVSCRDGCLALTEVQPEGKRKMSGEEFLRGRQHLLGRSFT